LHRAGCEDVPLVPGGIGRPWGKFVFLSLCFASLSWVLRHQQVQRVYDWRVRVADAYIFSRIAGLQLAPASVPGPLHAA
jgi:hypothetical protein